MPFGVLAIISLIAIGWYQNTLNITWHILPILLLYPFWGIIQQFLVIGLIAGNLNDLKSVKVSNYVIILLTALLFGAIHAPYWWLVIGTFVLALFYGFVYLEGEKYLCTWYISWLVGSIIFLHYSEQRSFCRGIRSIF